MEKKGGKGLEGKEGFEGKEGGKGSEGLKGIKMAYIGDGNNVCHSLMFAAAKVGMNLTIATPSGYEPKEEIVKLAFEDGKKAGIEIDILNDPIIAAKDADVIYTDVWASMGQEAESKKRKKAF